MLGVAWGQPRRAGRWKEAPALVAHVRWKHEPDRADHRVPSALDGYATDVLEVGQPVTVSGSFDHSDDVIAPSDTGPRASTPTLLQLVDGVPLALVSGHGTLPIEGGAFGDAAGASVRLSDPSFGHADGVLTDGALGQGYDFALARFDGAPIARWTSWHYVAGQPPIRGRRELLVPGEALYHFSNLVGRRSRVQGFYRQDVLDDVELEDAHVGWVHLGALLFVQSYSDQWPFALPGDSGSLVVDARGHAVGVIVGSTRDRRWAYVMTFGNLGFLLGAERLGWFLS